MPTKAERKALLKLRVRLYAAALIWSTEAAASGHFDDLVLSHDEMTEIDREMKAIATRIQKTATGRH